LRTPAPARAGGTAPAPGAAARRHPSTATASCAARHGLRRQTREVGGRGHASFVILSPGGRGGSRGNVHPPVGMLLPGTGGGRP
jgi:hypothetical protein